MRNIAIMEERRTRLSALALVTVLAVLLPASALPGQKIITRSMAEGFNYISSSHIAPLVGLLASEEMEGRKAGEKGSLLAARILESQYKMAGFAPYPGQPSMFQEFSYTEVTRSERTSMTVRSKKGERRFSLMKDFILLSTHHEPFKEQAPLLFVGYGWRDSSINYNDYSGLDPKGKVVVAFTGVPKTSKVVPKTPIEVFRSLKLRSSIAKELGAKGIIFIDDQFVKLGITAFRDILLEPKAWLSPPEKKIPELVVNAEVGADLLRSAGKGVDPLAEELASGRKSTSVDISQTRISFDLQLDKRRVKAVNVVAYLEGSDPILKNDVVVIGAHYDHLGVGSSGNLYPGADDNASGSAVIIEVAKALAMNKLPPKRSVIMISFSGEEAGMVGSEFYVQHPLHPLETTTSMINVDMAGRNSIDSLFAIGSNFQSLDLHTISESAARDVKFSYDYRFNRKDHPERLYYRSDQKAFAENGIPSLFLTSGDHSDYHRPSDTIEKLDYAKLEKVSKLVYLIAWNVANMEHELARNGLLVSPN